MIRTLVLTVPVGEVEVAADRLWGAGAQAVEERRVDVATVQLWTMLGGAEDESVSRVGVIPAGWSIESRWIDESPSLAWRDHACPTVVDDAMVIRPAWLPPLSLAGVTEIVIEPAASFGLGDHPTTTLVAKATRRLVRSGDLVLDVGCGSGVVAIIAALGGAANVVAIDTADAAVDATIDNAARNGVSDLICAGSTPLAEVEGSFDLVVANILAPVLIELAEHLKRVTRQSGTLVISGILEARHDHVLAAFEPMTVVGTDVIDGWAAVELKFGLEK